MIENRINEIVKQRGSIILIFKGFETNMLPIDKKYFDFNIGYIDKIDLESIKEQVLDKIIENRKFAEDYKWMTMEEYQIFNENASISKMPIVLLENDLYDKQFPYRDTLSDISNVYKILYEEEDVELKLNQKELYEKISLFYGQIDYSEQSRNYYVTYPVIEEDVIVEKYYHENPLKVELSKDIPEENIQQIELSDNEIPFLDLEEYILGGENIKNVVIILSSPCDTLPNRYLERLNILKKLADFNLYFTELSMANKTITNEKDYVKILNEIYNYPSFNKIPFYKDIVNRSKETIEISQVQIINDIVTQAEMAINELPFRDIYITASTGAGKSIMFQIPALYLVKKHPDKRPLTLVISPLIGLMNDQVDSMRRKGVNSLATINGNTPPYEKEIILEKIKKNEVDVLYLSPETLQSRSDIKMLIGDRRIGVVIIDEAHIVTTWGKSFRADYWYLGIYLTKLRKVYKFPIVTFTATSIYGGREDMYLDTRNSLNMISPISYFGKVRRDDILMNVTSSEKDFNAEGRDYRKTKKMLALKHLQTAVEKNQKSLLYFPTIKLLSEFYGFILQNEPEIAKKTGKYYGTLQKEEKDTVLSEYKSGELQFVLATKAFGMGIDIPDITNVYHYAPTGNVVDYIQEIGRAARDNSKVRYGFGIIDFLPQDMNEVKQLYGMSAIKKTQILEVMGKVLSVYKEKGYNRNLIISPEDFKYIFVQNNRDEESLDNKVKTVLLMIEKDFSAPNKLGYSPFVARPRSLFGNDLIFVTSEFEVQILKSNLKEYFSKKIDLNSKNYVAIYQVNLCGIWEKYYNTMSYPSFKHALFKDEEIKKLGHHKLFSKFIYTSGVEVSLGKDISVEYVLSQYRIILEMFEEFVNIQKISEKQFTIIDLGNHISKKMKIVDKFEARAFAQNIINAAFEFRKIKNTNFISERTNSSSDNQRYIVSQDGDVFTNFILSSITKALKPSENYIKSTDNITTFGFRNNDSNIDAKIAALGIGEARKLLNFQVVGGSNPQIYLRMNSVHPLEKAIKQGDYYRNEILEDIQSKHYISVEMLKYLFTKEQPKSTSKNRILNYTSWFWNNIEDYFMGILPDEVSSALYKK